MKCFVLFYGEWMSEIFIHLADKICSAERRLAY